MTEPVEAQIARMDERLNTIMNELVQARDGRKHQYEKLEDMGRSLLKLNSRVESVENSLARASPTIDEFITIKHKVVGAGIAGKWLWMFIGATVGILASSRTYIMEWMSK